MGMKELVRTLPKVSLSLFFYDVVVVVVGQPPLCIEIKSFLQKLKNLKFIVTFTHSAHG